jgi:hypothetical protein
VDIKSLIKNAVKHQKQPVEEPSSGLAQFAPKIEEEAPAAEPKVKKISDHT